MKFEFSDTHDALRQLVAEICQRHGTPRGSFDDGRVIDVPLWDALRSAGICGIAAPESYDGGDAGPVELMIVAEELGRAVGAVPFTEHAAAQEVLRLHADEEQAKRYLAAAARGEIVAAIVMPDPENLRAVSVHHDGGWQIEGKLPLVHNAAAAQLVVVPAVVDSQTRWFVVAEGAVVTPLPSIDATRPAASLKFTGTACEMLAGGEPSERPTELLLAMAAAEAVGVAAYALDTTSRYTREREQFGLPIGTFQAVKHRLADMLVDVENSRSAVYGAAWELLEKPCAPSSVALAQAVATQNANATVSSAIQLHGGIGVTWECDLHLYLRRAKVLQQIYGMPAQHRARIAESLLGQPV
jgi:alkylation response protein AidB-like acyl-CoA dehydrogenase